MKVTFCDYPSHSCCEFFLPNRAALKTALKIAQTHGYHVTGSGDSAKGGTFIIVSILALGDTRLKRISQITQKLCSIPTNSTTQYVVHVDGMDGDVYIGPQAVAEAITQALSQNAKKVTVQPL